MKSLTDLTANIEITDQAKYQSFWNKYKRPPEEEYRKKIIDRVDLLVSQDLRERDGDFFTPKMWADRGIEYLNKAIGTDQNDQQSWLKDYYVWDCCCGTGNLLQDFRPEFQHKCFLSSLKRCHLRLIKSLGRLPNTPDSQIFQFDFLNDDWKPQAEGGKIPFMGREQGDHILGRSHIMNAFEILRTGIQDRAAVALCICVCFAGCIICIQRICPGSRYTQQFPFGGFSFRHGHAAQRDQLPLLHLQVDILEHVVRAEFFVDFFKADKRHGFIFPRS